MSLCRMPAWIGCMSRHCDWRHQRWRELGRAWPVGNWIAVCVLQISLIVHCLELAHAKGDVHQVIGRGMSNHTGHQQTPPVDLEALNFPHGFGQHSGAVIDQLVEFKQLRVDIVVRPIWKLYLIPSERCRGYRIVGLCTDELSEHSNGEVVA